MKVNIKNNKHNKYISIIIVVLILIFIMLVLEILGITRITNLSSHNTNTQNTTDQTINDTNKDSDTLKNKTNAPSSSDVTSNPTVDDIGLTTRRETDGSITIITQLKNYSDGTCELMVKNGDETYTENAAILYQPAFSTCEGFNIKSDVISPGNWKITLSVTSKGILNSKTVELEI